MLIAAGVLFQDWASLKKQLQSACPAPLAVRVAERNRELEQRDAGSGHDDHDDDDDEGDDDDELFSSNKMDERRCKDRLLYWKIKAKRLEAENKFMKGELADIKSGRKKR